MTYLVDANILSEPTKPAPDPKVVEWLIANEADFVVDSIIYLDGKNFGGGSGGWAYIGQQDREWKKIQDNWPSVSRPRGDRGFSDPRPVKIGNYPIHADTAPKPKSKRDIRVFLGMFGFVGGLYLAGLFGWEASIVAGLGGATVGAFLGARINKFLASWKSRRRAPTTKTRQEN